MKIIRFHSFSKQMESTFGGKYGDWKERPIQIVLDDIWANIPSPGSLQILWKSGNFWKKDKFYKITGMKTKLFCVGFSTSNSEYLHINSVLSDTQVEIYLEGYKNNGFIRLVNNDKTEYERFILMVLLNLNYEQYIIFSSGSILPLVTLKGNQLGIEYNDYVELLNKLNSDQPEEVTRLQDVKLHYISGRLIYEHVLVLLVAYIRYIYMNSSTLLNELNYIKTLREYINVNDTVRDKNYLNDFYKYKYYKPFFNEIIEDLQKVNSEIIRVGGKRKTRKFRKSRIKPHKKSKKSRKRKSKSSRKSRK
jgi:hypothetical protein